MAVLGGGGEDIDLSGRNQAVANSSSHLLSAPQRAAGVLGARPCRSV